MIILQELDLLSIVHGLQTFLKVPGDIMLFLFLICINS